MQRYDENRAHYREIKWSTFVISSVIERSLHALRLVEMTKGKGGRDDKKGMGKVADSTGLLSLLPVQSDGAAVALTVFLQ